MNTYRDTHAVISHRNRVTVMQCDQNVITAPSQRLVNRIIHHLINKVMQGTAVCATDIHPWPQPDMLHRLQLLDIFLCIGLSGRLIYHHDSFTLLGLQYNPHQDVNDPDFNIKSAVDRVRVC